MEIGNLIKCDDWVHGGKVGIVINVHKDHKTQHLPCAYIFLDSGIELVRFRNLTVLQ